MVTPFQTDQTQHGSILALLKSSTREEHESIERHLDFFSKVKNVPAYRSFLAKFLGYFEPLEAAVRQCPALHLTVPDLPSRMRSSLLELDLINLGLHPKAIQALPRCKRMPAIHNSAEALGCLYVAEGSTLGGQMLARHIEGVGGIPTGTSNFFRSHGEGTGTMWKQFGAYLESYARENPDQSTVMCASARQTFRCLAEWMAAPECNAGVAHV